MIAGTILWTVVVVSVARGGPISAADASRAAAEVLDSSYQTELPQAAAPMTRPVIVPMVLPSGLLAVVWVVVALLLLVWLGRTLILPRLLHEDRDEAATAPADLLADDLPLPDHAALAAARQFAEAIHVLLLGALALTARRLRTSLADSLTSREALGRFALPTDQRDDLRLLLHHAEICHFGARDADAPMYRDCLASYERLRRAAS